MFTLHSPIQVWFVFENVSCSWICYVISLIHSVAKKRICQTEYSAVSLLSWLTHKGRGISGTYMSEYNKCNLQISVYRLINSFKTLYMGKRFDDDIFLPYTEQACYLTAIFPRVNTSSVFKM